MEQNEENRQEMELFEQIKLSEEEEGEEEEEEEEEEREWWIRWSHGSGHIGSVIHHF